MSDNAAPDNAAPDNAAADKAAPATDSNAGELVRLAEENAELRRRVDAAQATIAELRTEAIERRAEVRSLAEALPTAMSRHALVHQMLHDARHHPDKRGVFGRAVRKLGRAPRKAARMLLRRT